MFWSQKYGKFSFKNILSIFKNWSERKIVLTFKKDEIKKLMDPSCEYFHIEKLLITPKWLRTKFQKNSYFDFKISKMLSNNCNVMDQRYLKATLLHTFSQYIHT